MRTAETKEIAVNIRRAEFDFLSIRAERNIYLEQLNPFEGVEVDVNGDLGFEFIRENTCYPLLIERLLVCPEVVEPLYHAILQLFRNFPVEQV